ncbi:FAD/NAD(P)-binding domain-containing protein [Metschnikowia bicuspidata var. bicuspidata NRRL YB-4993]|uniref:FAD/NAD(P)-binding domain-containing protein n=1 Tax=Metschnikowia bicuspidata var. bicuspidata NRRL YB-4993 TaxID=869754 RepID=A0A1A0H215_9ASCO|nr:FAD/NAD(P)-binding domain-containing protein [Metschnikowia bicuspidata var. bicuspidata NRRL YB-4993]OBA17995.1 FAD/NAD(P)-binding domain-containing protein [Metschnikowia bicuspidata var. bicuspidata NRRL YB-4993]
MPIVNHIAVIGAGPAGLAAAKALALEPANWIIDVFERRDSIGGVWNFTEDKSTVAPPIPSTDPNGEEKHTEYGNLEIQFPSSMYKKLETNLTDTLMEYSNVPFQPRKSKFIDRSEVLQYLHKYADTIPKDVHFNFKTNVLGVKKNSGESKWTVTTENLTSAKKTTDAYDAVVVANGHYEHPFIPDTPGLKKWSERDPHSVTHSKYFVSSADFRNETVLIIGNFASGMDLAMQIGTTAKQVYVSTKDETLEESQYDYVKKVRLVTKYDVSTRKAHTVDGATLDNIDRIVFCTGFLYTFPFLRNYSAEITNGVSVKSLYKQTFYVDDPTLLFIGLTKMNSPLPISESQAAVVARVLSGRILLPSVEEMRLSYEAEFSAKGEKEFHSLKGCDYLFANELYDWIVRSGTEKKGLLPLFWDEKKSSEREGISEVKKNRNIAVAKYADQLRAEGREFEFPKQD